MYDVIKFISQFLFENWFLHFEIKVRNDSFNINLLVKDSQFQRWIVLYPIMNEKDEFYIWKQLNGCLKYWKW